MTAYAAGTSAALSAEYRQYAGGPMTVMSGVTITITNVATGATAVATTAAGVVNPSTGVYTYAWAISGAQAVGDYLVTWSGVDPQTDVVSATEIVQVTAAASGWAPDYVTLAQAKAFLRIGDTVDDTELAGWITAASRAIDKKCNRQFGQLAAPVTRTYRQPAAYDSSTGLWLASVDDVMTTTGMTVSGVAYASSGAVLLPDNAPLNGRPWTRLGLSYAPTASYPGAPATWSLTAQFGWTAVPAQVIAACKLQINRWNSRRDSPYGVAGSPEQGSEMRLTARLDPDVATSLLGLSRPRRVG